MKNIIEISGLNKIFTLHQFNGKKIIGCKDVNISIGKGEFIGITGRSGIGKSTILKCIYRTYIPTSGKILFNSEILGSVDLATSDERNIMSIRQHEIGYVSQFLKVLPRMSAIDVVAQSLIERGYSKNESIIEAETILHHFQIPNNLWDAYPNTFSGGEKLRLNLAQAMIKCPKLLLLDEPTASLDKTSKELVKTRILELKKSGTSMIGTFHDIEFMNNVVDNKYSIKNGIFSEDIA